MFYNSVDPLELSIPAEEAWAEIKKTVKSLPRTTVITENEYYIHVTCTSLVFRFVDNLELLLDRNSNTVSIRSGSFIALFDLGVNWLRTNNLRNALIEKGIVQ